MFYYFFSCDKRFSKKVYSKFIKSLRAQGHLFPLLNRAQTLHRFFCHYLELFWGCREENSTVENKSHPSVAPFNALNPSPHSFLEFLTDYVQISI